MPLRNPPFGARLGVGTPAPAYLLDVLGNGTWAAHFTNTAPHGNTVLIEQPVDLDSVIDDCVNIVHRNTGDGIFFNHYGGRPSGFAGSTGGKASLNVLIPQYIDYQAGSNGRTQGAGTLNTKTEQLGLYVEVQPSAASAGGIAVYSWSNSPAILIGNQPSAGGYPSGNGRGLEIDSLGSGIALYVNNQPTGSGAGEGVNISSLGAGHPLFVAAKGAGNVVFDLTSTGGVVVNDNASSNTTALFSIVARSSSTVGLAMNVTGDTGGRIQVRPDSIRFGDGTGTIDCNLFRQGTKAMRFGDASGGNIRLEARGGVSTLVKAGAVVDGDFPSTPNDGTLAVDSTNGRLYFRYGGAWHYVAQTA